MASITTTIVVVVFYTIASLFLVSSAQNCQNFQFSNNMVYKSCTDLPVLAAYLHWTYNSSSATVHVAYRTTQTPRGWIAWGINPSGEGMIGTQALVAYQDNNGNMKAYTSPITSYHPDMKPDTLTFPVSELSAVYLNNEMIISAEVGPLSNGPSINIVWQAGDSVVNDNPQPHPYFGPYIRSYETLNFLS